MLYAAVILIFLTIWALLSVILTAILNKGKPIDKLKQFDDDYLVNEKLENHKNDQFTLLKSLSGFIPKIRINKKRGKKLEEDLLKADIPITIEELMVIKILLSTCTAFLAFALSRTPIATTSTLFFMWYLPNHFISYKKQKRIKEFNIQLNEGIMIISNSLKAGYSFFQAVSTVVEETSGPFSKEFKQLLKEMSFGIAEEDALKNLMTRMESDDLKLVINAILIQKDIGGNLSEILDNIGDTIRERQKIQNELKTLTAQGKLSGIIVVIIPFFLGSVIYLFNKDYMIVLFTNPIGIGMVAASAVNMLFGIFIIKKIIHIDM